MLKRVVTFASCKTVSTWRVDSDEITTKRQVFKSQNNSDAWHARKDDALELVNWWNNFIGTTPKEGTFSDLDQDPQRLLLKWEEALHKKASLQSLN